MSYSEIPEAMNPKSSINDRDVTDGLISVNFSGAPLI